MTRDLLTLEEASTTGRGRRGLGLATTAVLASTLVFGGGAAAHAVGETVSPDALPDESTLVVSDVDPKQYTGFYPTLNGPEYWISEDNVRAVIEGLRGGTLGKVLEVIPGIHPVAKILTGPVTEFGAGKLEKCAVDKKGIVILLPWIGLPQCRAQ